MNNLLPIITIFALLLSVQSLSAQTDPVIDKIIEIGKEDNQTMDHLDILCNRFGGRLVGSDAYENAGDWTLSKFEEWGMTARKELAGTLPVGFNRGPWFGKMLGENGMSLHFATPSYTSGTRGVQRGHVMIEPQTKAQFERMKGKLKGSWVLVSGMNSGWPIDYSETGDSIRAVVIEENEVIQQKNSEIRRANRAADKDKQQALLEYKSMPALFYKEMVEAGILGIIQKSKTPIRALYDRKNIMDMTFETLPTIPDIKLDEHQYAIIEQMAKERRYFQLEFDIRNHFKMGPIDFYNYIGEIKGTKYPDEYVIMGGHLDAFDVATGGVDDGSGVTPAMEAARMIMEAGGKPKRSILVCMWAGEEFGLLGSKAWIESHSKELDKVSNMFNRDGGPTVPNSISVSDKMFNDMVSICAPINSINSDFPFEVKKRKATKKPTKASGTDSGSFAVKGIPTVGFGTGDPKGYDFSYGEIWHTERDLYNKSIPEYQNHTSIVTAIVIYGVANLDYTLPREGFYISE